MAECRSLTNICGNAVAAVVIARMEGELDRATFNAAIRGEQKSLYSHLAPCEALLLCGVSWVSAWGG